MTLGKFEVRIDWHDNSLVRELGFELATKVLIETAKRFCPMVAAISSNASVELFLGKKV